MDGKQSNNLQQSLIEAQAATMESAKQYIDCASDIFADIARERDDLVATVAEAAKLAATPQPDLEALVDDPTIKTPSQEAMERVIFGLLTFAKALGVPESSFDEIRFCLAYLDALADKERHARQALKTLVESLEQADEIYKRPCPTQEEEEEEQNEEEEEQEREEELKANRDRENLERAAARLQLSALRQFAMRHGLGWPKPLRPTDALLSALEHLDGGGRPPLLEPRKFARRSKKEPLEEAQLALVAAGVTLLMKGGETEQEALRLAAIRSGFKFKTIRRFRDNMAERPEEVRKMYDGFVGDFPDELPAEKKGATKKETLRRAGERALDLAAALLGR